LSQKSAENSCTYKLFVYNNVKGRGAQKVVFSQSVFWVGTIMVEFHTIDGILRFALALEASSENLYHRLADAIADPAVQSIFTALAQAEARQRESIELELFKIGSTITPSDVPSEPTGEEWPELPLLARGMSVKDAFDLAMQRQRCSFQLFSELMAGAENPEAADVLFSLAEREMRHLIQLERDYKSVFPQ
jgi:rubrerythrin